MRAHSLLIVLLVVGIILPVQAQPERCTTADGDACQIEIHVDFPAWTIQHPVVLGTVMDYFTEQVETYSNSLSVNGFEIERGLFFDMRYREFWHSDTMVSLLFTDVYDLGGLYPLSHIRAFTFDLETEQQIQFEDLFDYGAIPYDELMSYFGEELAFIIEGGSRDPDLYRNFVLTETNLILYFPEGRIGAINAGIMEYVIPLEDLPILLEFDQEAPAS